MDVINLTCSFVSEGTNSEEAPSHTNHPNRTQVGARGRTVPCSHFHTRSSLTLHTLRLLLYFLVVVV